MYERPHWDRPMLKDYAKGSLKNFYWKAVLASLIVSILTGAGLNTGSNSGVKVEQEFSNNTLQNPAFTVNDVPVTLEEFLFPGNPSDAEIFGIVGLIFLVVALIALVIGSVYSIFIANPLTVGHNRFYLDSRFAPTDIGRIFSGFTGGNYGNVVKTMFLKSLYEFGWTLFFIIPGIIKSYEYAMVPYILAENPDISSERAFELSKEMMNGRKWDLFVLDLSFFGWSLLASIVVIGHIFLNPYINATHAEVYLWLRYDALHNGYAQPSELNGLIA